MTQPRYIRSLSGPSLPEAHCNRCGKLAAWAKSARTGKSYLCEVGDSYGRPSCIPWTPHKCVDYKGQAIAELQTIIESYSSMLEIMPADHPNVPSFTAKLDKARADLAALQA